MGILLLGASWTSCSSSSNAAGGGDAGDDGDATVADSTIVEDTGCSPCESVCPCQLGDTFPNACTGETVTCTGATWGIFKCGGQGCVVDSGDESDCDPCTDACTCMQGYPPRYNAATCSNVSCTTGTWGPNLFCPGATCDAGIDASNESGADVIPDATPDVTGD